MFSCRKKNRRTCTVDNETLYLKLNELKLLTINYDLGGEKLGERGGRMVAVGGGAGSTAGFRSTE